MERRPRGRGARALPCNRSDACVHTCTPLEDYVTYEYARLAEKFGKRSFSTSGHSARLLRPRPSRPKRPKSWRRPGLVAEVNCPCCAVSRGPIRCPRPRRASPGVIARQASASWGPQCNLSGQRDLPFQKVVFEQRLPGQGAIKTINGQSGTGEQSEQRASNLPRREIPGDRVLREHVGNEEGNNQR